MCKVSNDKIKFKDGTNINIRDIDLENISKEQMLELYDTNMTLYDGISIRKNLHELRNDIQKIFFKLDENLTELKFHSSECPINHENIKQLAREELDGEKVNEILERKWAEILKKKVLSVGSIAIALTAIIGLIILIRTVSK